MSGGRFLKKTIEDLHLNGKTVLMRADYNVPLSSDGTIADDLRIKASLPTITYLLEHGARVVLISHLGRPDGKADPKYTLEPIAHHLSELLGRPVTFVPTSIGDGVKQAVKKSAKNAVLLLENVRYHAEDEANDEAFGRELAQSSQADYFVQDGFGVVHRAHASTDAVTHYLPSVAGLLLKKEVATILGALDRPVRPFIAILGGAKVSDKVEVIERFVELADRILIGGAMANTFLAYRGIDVGASKVEAVDETLARIYHKAARKVGAEHIDEFILLPTDVAVAKSVSPDEERHSISVEHIAKGEMALDIGDVTIEKYAAEIEAAHTVIWNGTLGLAELPAFAHGSARAALEIAKNPALTSIVGGGDTADFVLKWSGEADGFFTHVSTGGGASLELMAGRTLPGIAALMDA